AFLVVLLFYHAPTTPQLYTLSLHDALPISTRNRPHPEALAEPATTRGRASDPLKPWPASATSTMSTSGEARTLNSMEASEGSPRSEEHTSELQSPCNLVCRLLLEKKKKKKT